ASPTDTRHPMVFRPATALNDSALFRSATSRYDRLIHPAVRARGQSRHRGPQTHSERVAEILAGVTQHGGGIVLWRQKYPYSAPGSWGRRSTRLCRDGFREANPQIRSRTGDVRVAPDCCVRRAGIAMD